MHPARFAVNCSILFTELPLLDRPAAARQAVMVAQGLGCRALRVFDPDDILPALDDAEKLLAEHQVPVVVEAILERITNVSMGTELDNVVEFEELADVRNPVPTLSGPRQRTWRD